VHVHQAVFFHDLGGPFVGLLELRRAREARTDAVRDVFEIQPGLAVVADFHEDLRIGGNQRIHFIRRRSKTFPRSDRYDRQRRKHAHSHHSMDTHSHPHLR